jgi:ElaB/YqjD/DUF883 family membrane-anchored ribosome-binding protein
MDAAKLKEDVHAASRTIQEGLSEGLGRVQETMEERLRRGADRTQSMFTSMNDEFGSYVRESPLIALGGAFAVGYLIAKLARAFK